MIDNNHSGSSGMLKSPPKRRWDGAHSVDLDRCLRCLLRPIRSVCGMLFIGATPSRVPGVFEGYFANGEMWAARLR